MRMQWPLWHPWLGIQYVLLENKTRGHEALISCPLVLYYFPDSHMAQRKIQHPTYCIQWEIYKDTWPFQTPTPSIPPNFSFSLHQPYSYPPQLDVYDRQQIHQQSIMGTERRDQFYPDLWPTTKGIWAASSFLFPVWAVKRGSEEKDKHTQILQPKSSNGKNRSMIKLIQWKVFLIFLFVKSSGSLHALQIADISCCKKGWSLLTWHSKHKEMYIAQTNIYVCWRVLSFLVLNPTKHLFIKSESGKVTGCYKNRIRQTHLHIFICGK